jgi:hypothetical protein
LVQLIPEKKRTYATNSSSVLVASRTPWCVRESESCCASVFEDRKFNPFKSVEALTPLLEPQPMTETQFFKGIEEMKRPARGQIDAGS